MESEKACGVINNKAIQDSALICLPAEIRQTIYDHILPYGSMISLVYNGHYTSLRQLFSLSQTCRTIHDDVKQYLANKPLTLRIPDGLELNLLNGLPKRILSKISILIIEDHPQEPYWKLLPELRYICLVDQYDKRVTLNKDNIVVPNPNMTVEEAVSAVNAHPKLFVPPEEWQDISRNDLWGGYPPPVPIDYPAPTTLFQPSTTLVLRDAQLYWKRLRLHHTWLRDHHKDESPIKANKIRILLRRVTEAQFIVDHATMLRIDSVMSSNEGSRMNAAKAKTKPPYPSSQVTSCRLITMAWHSVLDVNTPHILEAGYLPEQQCLLTAEQEKDRGYYVKNVFPYAGMTKWWKDRA